MSLHATQRRNIRNNGREIKKEFAKISMERCELWARNYQKTLIKKFELVMLIWIQLMITVQMVEVVIRLSR